MDEQNTTGLSLVSGLRPASQTCEQILTQPESLLVLMRSSSEQILTQQECKKYARCRKPTCIHCQTYFQGKKVKEVTKNVKQKNLIRLILTVKANPDQSLSELLAHLYHSFKQLRRTSYWKKNIKGGLARLHVDHTGACWHPHFDIIAEPNAVGDLEEAKLSTLWESVTNDSYYVHIQTVTKTEISHLKLSTYILKPTFKSIKDNENLMHVYSQSTRGIKKLQRFGTWVNTKFRKDWKK